MRLCGSAIPQPGTGRASLRQRSLGTPPPRRRTKSRCGGTDSPLRSARLFGTETIKSKAVLSVPPQRVESLLNVREMLERLEHDDRVEAIVERLPKELELRPPGQSRDHPDRKSAGRPRSSRSRSPRRSPRDRPHAACSSRSRRRSRCRRPAARRTSSDGELVAMDMLRSPRAPAREPVRRSVRSSTSMPVPASIKCASISPMRRSCWCSATVRTIDASRMRYERRRSGMIRPS